LEEFKMALTEEEKVLVGKRVDEALERICPVHGKTILDHTDQELVEDVALPQMSKTFDRSDQTIIDPETGKRVKVDDEVALKIKKFKLGGSI
jgi:hypothetical protein